MADPDSLGTGGTLRLSSILNPASVAIVGASSDRRAFGGFVLGNLLRFG